MQEPDAATPAPMGRKPLGGERVETVMVPMRWPKPFVDRIDAFAGKGKRSAFIRAAVAEKLERENER